jgi:hypothetical protein
MQLSNLYVSISNFQFEQVKNKTVCKFLKYKLCVNWQSLPLLT